MTTNSVQVIPKLASEPNSAVEILIRISVPLFNPHPKLENLDPFVSPRRKNRQNWRIAGARSVVAVERTADGGYVSGQICRPQ